LGVKISDDYNAKFAIWTRDPKPQPEVKGPPLPKFSPQRFSTYEEFNRWKQELVRQIVKELPKPGE
jgi:hypothetical protein